MPGPLASVIWYLGAAFELGFVVCSIYRKSFVRYLFLNVYFLLTLSSSVFRHFVLVHSGVSSDEYRYTYFYSDAILTLVLYGALIGLYSKVFAELRFSRYVRASAVLLLLGTAAFSYAVVAQSQERLSTDFAYELSQNLYFVGLVLTYVLWGAILKLGETRTRLVQIVLSLGLYFSAYAASYALINLGSMDSVAGFIVPVVGCLLPLAWTVTIWRYSEDARLVPAHLVAVQR
ncbi:MAG TPA: hypothetical protein VMH31_04235 [Methylomirabilota bacterium]|nr:hypothetical protein [Methylomirabilota bacterium]